MVLNAKRTSSLSRKYTLTRDDREIGTFSLKKGRIGAQLSVDGADHTVRTHRFSRRYELLAEDGTVVASTTRVRRSWTLHASGQDWEFRQTAMAGREYTMLGAGGATAGTISRHGPGDADVSAELPELKAEAQVFVLVVVLLRQRRKRVAAAVRGGVLSGG